MITKINVAPLGATEKYMKKHLLYILFLFIAQCLGAQEIKVLEVVG